LGEIVHDPHSNILLRIIIQALIDYSNNRPCDLGKWRGDDPPGGFRTKCIYSEHICREHATNYLEDISSEVEQFIGLTPGTIQNYMQKLY